MYISICKHKFVQKQENFYIIICINLYLSNLFKFDRVSDICILYIIAFKTTDYTNLYSLFMPFTRTYIAMNTRLFI